MTGTDSYVTQALADNGVIELRHQYMNHWTSGLFNNADALLAAARKRHKMGNLFISLNRPSPRIASNRMDSVALRDTDFDFYTRIFFDFDPVKPKDCPSTAGELTETQRAALTMRDLLRRIHWPDPIVAISGNGTHLLYRTHLPNTAEVRDMLAVLYIGLHEDHAAKPVQFDKSVRNPARIGPLYGSVKRKGESTAERPHRQSRIIEWPSEWKYVPSPMIEKVAAYFARQHTESPVNPPMESVAEYSGSGDYCSLDIVAWFTAHGLYRRPLGIYEGAERHAVRCPWEGEHSLSSHDLDTSTVIFTATGGWPGFHCSHSHCEGRTIREVMQILEDADSFCAQQWSRDHV